MLILPLFSCSPAHVSSCKLMRSPPPPLSSISSQDLFSHLIHKISDSIKYACDFLSPLFTCMWLMHALRMWQVQHTAMHFPLWNRQFFFFFKCLKYWSMICAIDSSAPGVPSQSFADASRSPPARSMLRKLLTQKSSQPEVSAARIHCGVQHYSQGATWIYAN